MINIRHIHKLVGILLLGLFSLILIHDLVPLEMIAERSETPVPFSSESPTTDHSDGCDDSCPCVIHVFDELLDLFQNHADIYLTSSTIWHVEYLVPESTIPKGIDRPPEA
jgi:hypothetical protein